jgi:hypothetical protein
MLRLTSTETTLPSVPSVDLLLGEGDLGVEALGISRW